MVPLPIARFFPVPVSHVSVSWEDACTVLGVGMFRDRSDAGAQLGRELAHLAAQAPVVVGLARGGVPVAREVADVLGAPLDVLVVRKLGAPGREEFALGATGEGARVMNDRAVDRKSTRLTSSHVAISYAVFCLKKKSPFALPP